MKTAAVVPGFCVLAIAIVVPAASADETLAGRGWQATVAADGTLETLAADFGDGRLQPVPLAAGKSSGPAWYVRREEKVVRPSLTARGPQSPDYVGMAEGIRFRLQYAKDDAGRLTILAEATNTTDKPWHPETAGIKLGIDCLMESYPAWLHRFVPTMLRCEKTHFWGYAMAPDGRILGVASPDPVASWSVDFVGDHRIATFNLDLLAAGPLPARHPQDLSGLGPGESRRWRIVLAPLANLADVTHWAAEVTGGAMFAIDRSTVAPDEAARGQLVGPTVKSLTVADREGRATPLSTPAFTFSGDRGSPGLYTLTATEPSGRVSEASIFVRRPWAWYLEHARSEGLRVKPTATHHAECVYPFYSYFLARKHLPDPEIDAQCEAVFRDVFPKHYDETSGELRTSYRIQDTATWAGILADRYAVTHDERDLRRAAALCDFLILKQQGPDGGFYKTHAERKKVKPVLYSAVAYPVKSIMEVMTEEAPLAAERPEWRKHYRRQHAAVRRAVDDLARRGDDLETEGQATYEDGMISCSCAQLAMYALKLGDDAAAQRYVLAAKNLYNGHRCLTITASPEARVNGATIRFWETKYTICLMANLYDSPCGWTAWQLYADQYLYLLTGEEQYLREYFNGLGACVQLIDAQSGRLRWGFTPSPRVPSRYAVRNTDEPGREFRWAQGVFGEQYLEMISDWNRTQPIWRKKWGIDNFVHEVFKCMEEGALENVYLLQRADGSLACYNGTVTVAEGVARVTPGEAQAARLHVNLRRPLAIKVTLKNQPVAGTYSGRQWIGPGGVPPDLRPFLAAKDGSVGTPSMRGQP